MKYYVFHLSETNDGSLVKEVFDFNSLENAKSNHYYYLSSCYANTTLIYFMSEIIDESGIVITRDIHQI